MLAAWFRHTHMHWDPTTQHSWVGTYLTCQRHGQACLPCHKLASAPKGRRPLDSLHLLHVNMYTCMAACVSRFKPKQLQRNKALLKAIIEALCEMCCEPCPPDCDEAQETPPHKVAASTLDTLSIHLSSAAVFPTVWHFVQ